MQEFLSVILGIGLSAACGFRVFVPLLVLSIAVRAGQVGLGSGFEWIGSWPALLAFAVATGLELSAYYIPWLDNMLDLVATPAAAIAGTLVMASTLTGMNPMMRWSLAIIAGGGAAGAVQAMTGMTRLASTATTGGLGNPLVATAEAGGSILLSVLAVLLPLAAGLLVILVLWFVVSCILRRRQKAARA